MISEANAMRLSEGLKKNSTLTVLNLEGKNKNSRAWIMFPDEWIDV